MRMTVCYFMLSALIINYRYIFDGVGPRMLIRLVLSNTQVTTFLLDFSEFDISKFFESENLTIHYVQYWYL